MRKGLHVSEYGVLDDATGETHRCDTEHQVYALLGLEYIEPELRENRGELEAAANGSLPELIETADLKGDLHCHTTASDGTAVDRGDGAGRRGTLGTNTWPSPTTRPASGSGTTSPPTG